MLGVVNGMVNAMRLDSFFRKEMHGLVERGAPGSGASVPAAAARLGQESGRASIAQVPSVQPYSGKAVSTLCTDDDQAHLNKTMGDVESLVKTVGFQNMVHIFPKTCYEIITGGIDYASYDDCLQRFFEISPPCSKCHVSYLKSLAGADIFHLGCVKKCAPIVDQCGNETAATPEGKDCVGAVRNCITCAVPPSKDVLNCAGIPGREEVIRMLDGLVDFVSGDMTDPGAFQSFLRKVAVAPSPKGEDSDDTIWAVKWPAGLQTADGAAILAKGAGAAGQ